MGGHASSAIGERRWSRASPSLRTTPRGSATAAWASVRQCHSRGTREVLSDVNVEMRFAHVVGVGLSLFVLTALGGTAASSSPSLPLLPPPSFEPALDEWLTVTTGPTRHRFTVNPPRAIGI